jgi:hypothetical protein
MKIEFGNQLSEGGIWMSDVGFRDRFWTGHSVICHKI